MRNDSPLRVAFAGTPEFAAQALADIHAAGFAVPLVLTQPDRPAGRGMKLQASPVKRLAASLGIAVAQPAGLRLDGRHGQDAEAARELLSRTAPDVLVVAAYGLILPQWVLDLPRLGCLNIHGSLLPRWRGAAPIHRAIEAGDERTGITVMQMDAGLDTGDMLLEVAVDIGPRETTGSLHDKLAAVGGVAIVEALHQARQGFLRPRPQPSEGVTYAHKIAKDEAPIDWREPADVIERRIRAFDPFPGASLLANGAVVKCWLAELAGHAEAAAGTVIGLGDGVFAGCPVVACGDGRALRLLELQVPGGRRAPAPQVLAGGAAWSPGLVLQSAVR